MASYQFEPLELRAAGRMIVMNASAIRPKHDGVLDEETRRWLVTFHGSFTCCSIRLL